MFLYCYIETFLFNMTWKDIIWYFKVKETVLYTNWNKFKMNLKYYTSKDYRLYNHKIYIDLGFHKLWKDWWKVRKKINGKPRLVFYKGEVTDDNWCEYYMDIHASYKSFIDKWFAIHIEPMGYKTKWGENVWEYCPEVVIVFWKKIRCTIRLEAPKDVENCNWWWVVMYLLTQKKD